MADEQEPFTLDDEDPTPMVRVTRPVQDADAQMDKLERLEDIAGATMAFDLETVPQLAALDAEYDPKTRKVPAITKSGKIQSEEDLAAWVRNDKVQWEHERIKPLGMNPLTGRIVAIGHAWTQSVWQRVGVTESRTLLAQNEYEEAQMLRKFWRRIAQVDQVVTHNGHGFDVPFVLTRSLLLGVEPDRRAIKWLRRYAYKPHLDVYAALSNWQPKKGTLDVWAAAFGVQGKTPGITGADVWPMVQAERWADLIRYAAEDAGVALDLAACIAPVYLVD